jgi:replication factor A1
VSTIGKVTRKYDVREFAKGETTGKVCSVLLGDETASIRVVFWNEQVDQLSDVKENDIIAVKDAYAKENQNGREIHLGGRASIEINPAGITIDSVREGTSYQRKTIKELEANQTGSEIMATVVQVFDPRFFQVHPETGKRIQPGEDVTPALSYVLNMVVDDGTGTVRCVLWKNQTNHLLDKSAEELAQYNEQPNQFEDVKTDLLGEQFKLMGKVQKNDMFDRLEFVVQMVEKAKPEEELKKLQKES